MYNEELIAAKVAARNAGKILMKFYKSKDNEVQMKGIDNPVTIADNEADKYLSDFLMGEFPNDGWLSEETVDTKERLNKNRVWIVDPLDGTKEFIEGIPHFSVSIAILTEKCGIPSINSFVPSNGSTIQTLFLLSLSLVSTVSSESQPSLGNSPIKKSDRYLSASLSAIVTGLSIPFI